MNRIISLAGLAALVITPLAALAHHGWNWTTGINHEITGMIREVELGNPHGELHVDVDGTEWVVEVGQPWRNERAGLPPEAFAIGRTMTFQGEIPADPDKKLMKVERIIVDGKLHALYPERD